MAEEQLVSVGEYLHSSYEADRDLIDGRLYERHWGEMQHGMLQGAFAHALAGDRSGTGPVPLISVRVQTSPNRILVPDVCLVDRLRNRDDIVRLPPLLCVEILSRTDQFLRMLEKLDEYIAMGVPHIWLIDPFKRMAWDVQPDCSLTRVTRASLPGTGIQVALEQIFEDLEQDWDRPLRDGS